MLVDEIRVAENRMPPMSSTKTEAKGQVLKSFVEMVLGVLLVSGDDDHPRREHPCSISIG